MGWKSDTSREERRRSVALRLFGPGERFGFFFGICIVHICRALTLLFSATNSRHAGTTVTPAKNKSSPVSVGQWSCAVPGYWVTCSESCCILCPVCAALWAVPNFFFLPFFFAVVNNKNKFAFVFAERRTNSSTVPGSGLNRLKRPLGCELADGLIKCRVMELIQSIAFINLTFHCCRTRWNSRFIIFFACRALLSPPVITSHCYAKHSPLCVMKPIKHAFLRSFVPCQLGPATVTVM